MQIKELKIYSSNINAQTEFYSRILGLEIIKKSETSVRLKCGSSFLNMEYKPGFTPYHFAFNIPANKDLEAFNWLKSKVEILKNGEHEIQDFDFWNAKAIYFYDADYNIVEFIARKNLNNKSDDEFSSDQLIGISEIGLPTSDIEKEFNFLHRLTGVPIYDGSFERFCAIGDEHGLFICINKNVKDWFPTNEKAYSSEFEIEFIEQGKTYNIEYKNEELRLMQF